MIRVERIVEQRDAFYLHRADDGLNDFRLPARGEIGHALDDRFLQVHADAAFTSTTYTPVENGRLR